jgi:hypothetical protein
MSYKLFLDDERFPRNVTWVRLPSYNDWDWVIVRNYDDFVKTITEKGMPEFIAFDHDLADEHYFEGVVGSPPKYNTYKEKTGYEAAKWLRSYCDEMDIPMPAYTVHSMNSVGRANIHSALQSVYREG